MINDLSKHPVAAVISGFAIVATLIGFGFAWGSQTTDNVDLGGERSEAVAAEPNDNQSIANDSSLPESQDVEGSTEDQLDASAETTESDLKETRLRDLEPANETYAEWGQMSVGLGSNQEMLVFSNYFNIKAEYRLDRDFSTFRATVGFDDAGASNSSLEFWIEDEAENILFPKTTFGLGDHQEIEVDVSEAIRMVLRTSDMNSDEAIGVANGVLLPK